MNSGLGHIRLSNERIDDLLATVLSFRFVDLWNDLLDIFDESILRNIGAHHASRSCRSQWVGVPLSLRASASLRWGYHVVDSLPLVLLTSTWGWRCLRKVGLHIYDFMLIKMK